MKLELLDMLVEQCDAAEYEEQRKKVIECNVFTYPMAILWKIKNGG